MPSTHTPNIVLIMTDQLRYDALGINNSPICRTPSLDKLARQGMRFTNAYTPCGLCTPARASVLTGRYPHKHGLVTNNDMYHAVREDLPDNEIGFSSLLRDGGWACGYAGKWHVGMKKLPSHFGFVGMDLPGYGNPGELYQEYLREHGLTTPEIVGETIGPPGLSATLSGPVEATVPYFLGEYSIELLRQFAEQRQSSGQPFLLWCNFWGPHTPYFCVEPYASMYDPHEIPPWLNYADPLEGKPALHRRFLEAEFETSTQGPWEKWQPVVAKYWGRVTQIDAQIGRILEAIDRLGLAQDTVVIFTTDHGDSIGQHGGLFDKGPFMYEEVYHVPLIVRWPGHVTPDSRDENFVSLLDLMPTMLDLAGVPAPANVDGRSILPLLVGQDSESWPDYLVAEWHGHRFLYSQRMIRWRHYKYVFNPGDVDELYDLDVDPHELHNRIDDQEYQDLREHLQARLLQHLTDSRDPIRLAAWDMLSADRNWDFWELARPYHLQRQSQGRCSSPAE